MDKEILRYQILNLGIRIKRIKNLDEKLDIIIEKYYKHEVHFSPYINSKNKLIRMIIEEGFPMVSEWNTIAMEEGYFSHVSLEYISGFNWKQLQRELKKELKQILQDK